MMEMAMADPLPGMPLLLLLLLLLLMDLVFRVLASSLSLFPKLR
jgi:hypothetical protein